jgi:hypothetical protein
MVNGSERVWLYDGPHGQAERLEEFLPQGPLVVDTGGHDLADWTRHPDGGRLQRENLVPEAVQVQTTAASPWGCRVSMIVSLQTLRPRPYGWIPPPTCRCGW